MEPFKKIEIGVFVTLILAVISLAFYMGKKDTEIDELRARMEKLNPEQIENQSNLASKSVREVGAEVENMLASYELGPLRSRVTSIEKLENIRSFVDKGAIDSQCPRDSSAIHVPKSYLNRTGNEICNSNSRELKRCSAVNFVYVTNSNNFGRYHPHDKGCGEVVDVAWPWGASSTTPNTLNSEWGHGNTYAVCCF